MSKFSLFGSSIIFWFSGIFLNPRQRTPMLIRKQFSKNSILDRMWKYIFTFSKNSILIFLVRDIIPVLLASLDVVSNQRKLYN